MAFIRFQLDLAIPEEVYNKIPARTKKAFIDAIRALKAFAVKINEGEVNEENTTRATLHRCRHDEDLPCEGWEEI